MTKEEALQIPDLNIEVTDLIEDCFYLKMALDKRMSKEKGKEAFARIKERNEDIADALEIADKMIDNLVMYGVPCAAWC